MGEWGLTQEYVADLFPFLFLFSVWDHHRLLSMIYQFVLLLKHITKHKSHYKCNYLVCKIDRHS